MKKVIENPKFFLMKNSCFIKTIYPEKIKKSGHFCYKINQINKKISF